MECAAEDGTESGASGWNFAWRSASESEATGRSVSMTRSVSSMGRWLAHPMAISSSAHGAGAAR